MFESRACLRACQRDGDHLPSWCVTVPSPVAAAITSQYPQQIIGAAVQAGARRRLFFSTWKLKVFGHNGAMKITAARKTNAVTVTMTKTA